MNKAVNNRILPNHIGIIMDGNGRWANKRGLPRSAGHSAGSRTFKAIARYANKIGIKCLTVYAFSTENWMRPQEEVNSIMNILRNYLKDASNFKDENIKCRFIGDRTILDEDIKKLMDDAEETSKNATGLMLNIAINYGGQDEIIHAVKNVIMSAKPTDKIEDIITKNAVEACLYTAGQPPLDLIIRPSGEYRLSNFLTWQSAYAEFWFSDVLWPDFKPKHFDQAIEAYAKRERRFGGI